MGEKHIVQKLYLLYCATNKVMWSNQHAERTPIRPHGCVSRSKSPKILGNGMRDFYDKAKLAIAEAVKYQ